MPAVPSLWNAIVRGAWNRAILTPDGIRRHLYRLADDGPVELEMAVDKPGLFKVSHGGLSVSPTASALEVAPERPEIDGLFRACELCITALTELPRTPVSAAGINFRYTYEELPDDVLNATRAQIDDLLSDSGFAIRESGTSRQLTHAPGVINVLIKEQGHASGTLELNFHLGSASEGDLRAWLARTREFGEIAERLKTIIGSENVRRPEAGGQVNVAAR